MLRTLLAQNRVSLYLDFRTGSIRDLTDQHIVAVPGCLWSRSAGGRAMKMPPGSGGVIVDASSFDLEELSIVAVVQNTSLKPDRHIACKNGLTSDFWDIFVDEDRLGFRSGPDSAAISLNRPVGSRVLGISWTAGGEPRAFEDGSARGPMSASVGAGGAGAGPLSLGNKTPLSLTHAWSEAIEALIVVPEALSDSEMVELIRDISGIGATSYVRRQKPTYVSVGKCVDFDGSNDRVVVSDVLRYEKTDKFSIFAWIKTGTNAHMRIVDKNPSSGTWPGYTFGVFNTGKLWVRLEGSGASGNNIQVETNSIVTTNEWIFAGFTYDGSAVAAGVKMYLNGLLAPSTIVRNTLTNSILNTTPVVIGGSSVGTAIFKGKLDEISVWGKELTPSECAEIYDPGAPVDLRGASCREYLHAWWRMGEGDVYPILKDSINGYNGTMTNMAAGDIETREYAQPSLQDSQLCLLDARIRNDGSSVERSATVAGFGSILAPAEVVSGDWIIHGSGDSRWFSGNGSIAILNMSPSYGSWGLVLDHVVANTEILFTATDMAEPASNSGFSLLIGAGRELFLRRRIVGVGVDILSPGTVLDELTRYAFWVTRSTAGLFSVWIRGGAFAAWTLLGTVADQSNIGKPRYAVFSGTSSLLEIRQYQGAMSIEDARDLLLLPKV